MTGPDRRRFLITSGALLGAGAALPAIARPGYHVDLALVLAADCSGSVSSDDYTLQQEGYADAFRRPEVVKAIRSGINGAIAACYFQWSGYDLHNLIVPWSILRGDDSIATFATVLQHAERRLNSGGTAPGGAIAFGRRLLNATPAPALRQVIDISGDGRTNTGPPPDPDREAALASGITINGLPIENQEPQLEEYYREHIIGGPGAFLVPARDFTAFREAIRRKLVQEIAGLHTGDSSRFG